MAFSVQDFMADLAKDGLLTAEDVATVSAKFADARVAKRLEEMALRQSDYSRRMTEVQNKEKSLTETERALTQWKSEAEAKLKQAMTDRDSLRTTQSQYEAQVRKVADAYGFDADEVLKPNGQPVAVSSPMSQPSIDPNNFISKEEWTKQSATVQQLLPQLTGTMIDLAAQHQSLFGQPLGNSRVLLEKALAEKRSLEDVWADEYKVAERRQQVADEKQKQWEDKIRAEERQKIMSEQSLPMSARSDQPRAAVFTMGTESKKETTAPADQNRGVESAIRAWNEGKYRQV
jgi:hypothetical protein